MQRGKGETRWGWDHRQAERYDLGGLDHESIISRCSPMDCSLHLGKPEGRLISAAIFNPAFVFFLVLFFKRETKGKSDGGRKRKKERQRAQSYIVLEHEGANMQAGFRPHSLHTSMYAYTSLYAYHILSARSDTGRIRSRRDIWTKGTPSQTTIARKFHAARSECGSPSYELNYSCRRSTLTSRRSRDCAGVARGDWRLATATATTAAFCHWTTFVMPCPFGK